MQVILNGIKAMAFQGLFGELLAQEDFDFIFLYVLKDTH